MKLPRTRLNAVLLPTGQVVVVGGSFLDRDASTASLRAEIFDPPNETWTPAGWDFYPRLNHSSALLLPDATVLVVGSSPRDVWEEHMEIYSPAYLYNSDATLATRPVVISAPAEAGYGGTFPIKTPGSANIRDVVLVRAGSGTEQRVIGLAYTAAVPGQLQAVAPPNEAIAPSGDYLLFLINRGGVPSVAKFIRLNL